MLEVDATGERCRCSSTRERQNRVLHSF
jgi:hypothetical protein